MSKVLTYEQLLTMSKNEIANTNYQLKWQHGVSMAKDVVDATAMQSIDDGFFMAQVEKQITIWHGLCDKYIFFNRNFILFILLFFFVCVCLYFF